MRPKNIRVGQVWVSTIEGASERVTVEIAGQISINGCDHFLAIERRNGFPVHIVNDEGRAGDAISLDRPSETGPIFVPPERIATECPDCDMGRPLKLDRKTFKHQNHNARGEPIRHGGVACGHNFTRR